MEKKKKSRNPQANNKASLSFCYMRNMKKLKKAKNW